MANSFINKRVIFPKGRQEAFLERVREKLSMAEIAHISGRSERTVRDWKREKFSMPLAAVQALAAKTHTAMPKGIRKVDEYAHLAQISSRGMAAVTQKYGSIPRNEKYREKQWRAWWETEGKFKKNPILESKNIHKPRHSEELAEFVGIVMGDGGISKYQVIITLHHIDDLEYAPHVTKLIKKLFKITPHIYHSPNNSVNDIAVSRIELVRYLHELGLPIGNKIKQKLDIPEWIKDNQKFARACLRGLIDTDGCIFTHRYRAKGTWYAYKKLSFTSASTPLRNSVYALLKNNGFHPRITTKDVRLDRVEDMRRYFAIIKSHNPKHLRRYENTVE